MTDAVTRARELLAQPKIPLVYISDGSSAGNKMATLLDQRAEAFELVAELADEVDKAAAYVETLRRRLAEPKAPDREELRRGFDALASASLNGYEGWTQALEQEMRGKIESTLSEVERLRARLDAVVAIHSDRDGDCAECEMSTGQGVSWPCYTYSAALGVES